MQRSKKVSIITSKVINKLLTKGQQHCIDIDMKYDKKNTRIAYQPKEIYFIFANLRFIVNKRRTVYR